MQNRETFQITREAVESLLSPESSTENRDVLLELEEYLDDIVINGQNDPSYIS